VRNWEKGGCMNIFKRMYINFIMNREAAKMGFKRRKSIFKNLR
jgi:hypothetical protein